MATNAGKALVAVRRAQQKFEKTGTAHEAARAERRAAFEQAREAGLTLREIGEAAELHRSRVAEILSSE